MDDRVFVQSFVFWHVIAVFNLMICAIFLSYRSTMDDMSWYGLYPKLVLPQGEGAISFCQTVLVI